MAVILDLAVQGLQMLVVLAVAPLLTGFVRKVKARMLRRQGPPVIQPYRDLARPLRKGVVLAENASWLFRATPYLVFAATWVAAALVPTFASGLLFSWSADLIAIIALLASARFFLALAGMEIGTAFGGIGASREVMIATFAEPAMIMMVFTVALVAGSTQLLTVSAVLGASGVGLRVSLGLALVALIQVDAGSCDGCELEIHALNNAFYDLERFGLHVVASPRHADVLMVTGPVTKNMREALQRTWDATPGPKWVVAVGDCARDGGLFARSYAVEGGVGAVVPVDLHIPDCPPTPTALLKGLLTLLR